MWKDKPTDQLLEMVDIAQARGTPIPVDLLVELQERGIIVEWASNDNSHDELAVCA